MKKLAMIGCGGIGRYHLGHFVNFKDIELAGFCDLLIERAEEFVQIAGSGKAYSDFVKMYDEVKPDMVFICIPPSPEMTITGLSGLPILAPIPPGNPYPIVPSPPEVISCLFFVISIYCVVNI